MVRKELSDVLKHEIFRSGSVLRSTFFTILSLLLAVLLIFQILLYGNAYRGLRDNVRESGEAFLTLAAKLADRGVTLETEDTDSDQIWLEMLDE